MINRVKSNFQHYQHHCQRWLGEWWRFRKYSYSAAERERFYQSPSAWIADLFSNHELSANQRLAAKHLAGSSTGVKRHWAQNILDCLASIETGAMAASEVTGQISAETENQDPTACDHRFWLKLQRTLVLLGFLQAGGRMRDLALNSVLGQTEFQDKRALAPLVIFQAALERGDFYTASRFAKVGHDTIEAAESFLLQPLTTIFNQGDSVSTIDWERLLGVWDLPYRRFSELLKDKDVAIVGPSVTDSELSSEIEACDIVVRCGFLGSNSLPPGAGERTSVSFYAGHKVRELVNRGEGSLLDSLDLVLLKHRSDRKLLRQVGVADESIGLSLPARQAFFATHPMAIPQVVHNIIFARPSTVKIFKVNFFLEPGYPSGYEIGKELKGDTGVTKSGKMQDPAAKCESFAMVHDPLAQFRFMKHVWKCGLLEGDKEFTDIIKLNDEEYLQRLDRIYGYEGKLRMGA